MKKFFALTLAALLLFCSMGISAFAASESVTVYVSISDKGSLAVAQKKVTVTDIDGNKIEWHYTCNMGKDIIL